MTPSSADRGLVSVIIPTHNRADLLPRAVRSVFKQSYAKVEVIVVDDASADDTPEVVACLRRERSRLKYVRSEVNVGNPAARNIGIERASGDVLAFLDDDDEWLPRKLEYQLPHIAKYSVVGCLSHKDRRPANLPRPDIGNAPIGTKSIEEFHFDSGGFYPSTMVMEAENIRALGGFDENLTAAVGIDLFVRLVAHFGEAAYVKLPLNVYYTHLSHGKPRVTTSGKRLNGAMQEFKKNRHLRSRAAERFRLCDIELMRMNRTGSILDKGRHFLRSFRFVNPCRPLSYLKLYFSKVVSEWPIIRNITAVYMRAKYR